jgi:hypothetical protein
VKYPEAHYLPDAVKSGQLQARSAAGLEILPIPGKRQYAMIILAVIPTLSADPGSRPLTGSPPAV